jgi:membrane associated rhomboid family serine protease
VLIPIRCEPPPRRPSLVVPLLIGLNASVMVAGLLGERAFGWEVEALARRGALDPRAFAWWQLLSYQFLHDPWGIMHLLFNMVFLWVFGIVVEDRLGRVGFLAFYLAGGVVAGLVQIATSPAPVIGASGSTAAVAGAFLALFPRGRIMVLLFFLLIGVYSIPAVWFIGLYVLLDLLGAVGNLLGGRGSGVAFAAHLGGYAFGLGAGLALLATRVVPRGEFDLLYLLQQARRRRQMRAAVRSGGDPFRGHRLAKPPGEAARTPGSDRREEAARRTAAILRLLLENRSGDAASAYLALRRDHPDLPLPAAAIEAIAARLQSEGREAEAADAWEHLLETSPPEPRASEIRLLLSALCLRRLGEPARARRHLSLSDPASLDAPLASLLQQLRSELPRTDPNPAEL